MFHILDRTCVVYTGELSECCSRIGKISEEHPDMPFAMLREILAADQDKLAGEYKFG